MAEQAGPAPAGYGQPYGQPPGAMPYGPAMYGRAPGYPPHDPTLADPLSRLIARIIDVIIVFAGYGVVGAPVAGIQSMVDLDHGIGQVIGIITALIAYGVILLGPFVYEWLMVARSGATVGKRLMKVRVVNAADRSPVSYGRSAGRAACWLVLNFVPLVNLLDKLWLLWDKPLQQCLHDKPVRTVVVRTG